MDLARMSRLISSYRMRAAATPARNALLQPTTRSNRTKRAAELRARLGRPKTKAMRAAKTN